MKKAFLGSTLISAAYVGMAMFSGAVSAQSPAERDVSAGKAKVSMCIGCHGIEGYKASFPTVYTVPKIAGQSEKYLVNALVAYRKGERSHPTMKSIAWSLSDADIADLAAYYAKGGGSVGSTAAAAPAAPAK